MPKFLRSFPFLSAAFVQAALGLAVALGFHLTPGQTGSVEAVAAALLALLTMPHVLPLPLPLFTGAITALGALLIAFGVPHITSGTVAAVVAVVAAFWGGIGHVAAENKVLAEERAGRRAGPAFAA